MLIFLCGMFPRILNYDTEIFFKNINNYMAILTKEIIEKAAKQNGINPYEESFSPKDLGLDANKFGSFSDYCDNTKSSRYNRIVILKATHFNKGGRPTKYFLKN